MLASIECQRLAASTSKSVYTSNSLSTVGDVYLALGSHLANRQGFTPDEFSKKKSAMSLLLLLRWLSESVMALVALPPLMTGSEPQLAAGFHLRTCVSACEYCDC